MRSRAAVTQAATTLFLDKGYAGTTMEEIAALAGITKRTLYNNYADKEALFTHIVGDAIAYAAEFARSLRAEFAADMTSESLAASLHDLARRLALAILRPEIIALRRLIVREADTFPQLATDYYTRAPGQVIRALAVEFQRLGRANGMRTADARLAAEQFAYLVVGEPLDRAMLTGGQPSRQHVLMCAKEGVQTFLARYGTAARARRATPRSARKRG